MLPPPSSRLRLGPLPLSWMIGTFFLALFVCDLLVPLGFAVGLGYIIPVVLSFSYRDERATKGIAALGVALTLLGLALPPTGGTR